MRQYLVQNHNIQFFLLFSLIITIFSDISHIIYNLDAHNVLCYHFSYA